MTITACCTQPAASPPPPLCPPCPCGAASTPAAPYGTVPSAGGAASGAAGVESSTARDAHAADPLARYHGAPALATMTGQAAYYHDGLAGRPTASGEPYDPRGYTAAHRTLPLGAIVRITPQAGGSGVYVRINDRGPFGDERRIIDLSRAAAEELGMLRAGVISVRVEVVEYGRGPGRR